MEKSCEMPKIFWKYYDLFRRKKITLDEYSAKTAIDKVKLQCLLTNVMENQNNR